MPTAAIGFHVDPELPMQFDNTPNHDRPASHRLWWGIPYIVTNRDASNEVVSFDVRRLDGGAWDRSTSLGHTETLEGAVAICQRAAEDEMFECAECHATTKAVYSRNMVLYEGEESFMVTLCPVCGFVASKVKIDKASTEQ